MPAVDKPDGIIRAEGMRLDGQPVKLVERLPNERMLVDVMEEQHGRYVAGCRLVIGSAEFQPM